MWCSLFYFRYLPLLLAHGAALSLSFTAFTIAGLPSFSPDHSPSTATTAATTTALCVYVSCQFCALPSILVHKSIRSWQCVSARVCTNLIWLCDRFEIRSINYAIVLITYPQHGQARTQPNKHVCFRMRGYVSLYACRRTKREQVKSTHGLSRHRCVRAYFAWGIRMTETRLSAFVCVTCLHFRMYSLLLCAFIKRQRRLFKSTWALDGSIDGWMGRCARRLTNTFATHRRKSNKKSNVLCWCSAFNIDLHH